MSALTFSVDVTRECNLRCRHCYNYSGVLYTRLEQNDEELLSTAKQFNEVGGLSACLCGGEPLLRKEVVYRMVKAMHDNVVSVNLTSNGLLMDKDCARSLKDSGIYNVQISVDGNREAHNWLRNNTQAYDGAIRAIRILTNEGIDVGVACTPTKRNYLQIPDLIRSMDEMGVKLFRMQPIMNLGRARMIEDMYLSSEEYLDLSLELTKNSSSKNMKIEWGDPTQHLFYLGTGKKPKMICVNAYGDIMLSPYVPIVFGNTQRHRLSEYFDAGLLNAVSKSPLLMEIYQKTGYKLEGKGGNGDLPELYKDDMIVVDCIDDNSDDIERKINSV